LFPTPTVDCDIINPVYAKATKVKPSNMADNQNSESQGAFSQQQAQMPVAHDYQS